MTSGSRVLVLPSFLAFLLLCSPCLLTTTWGAENPADANTTALSPTAPPPPSGAQVTIDAHDDVVRIGHIFPLHISRQVSSAQFHDGPWQLDVQFVQNDQQLVNQELTLATLGQLQDGIQVNVVPTASKPSADPVMVRVILADAQRRVVERAELALPTPQGLQRAMLDACQHLLASHPGTADTLPFLWGEQAAELCQGDVSLHSCAHLHELTHQIDAWIAGARPALRTDDTNLLGLRDPVDSSIQPYRLTLPGPHLDPAPVVLVCTDTGPALTKVHWPQLTPEWLTAAVGAGMAVVEAYPGGDLAWRDVAPRRALLALAAARAAGPGLRPDRTILLGIGAGAGGVIRLAEEEPGHYEALVLIDPVLAPVGSAAHVPPLAENLGDQTEEAEALNHWMLLHDAGQRPTHLVGLPVILRGSTDAACQRWLMEVQHAGVQVTSSQNAPDTAAFWSTLASQNRRYYPSDIIVLQPGDIAGCRIDAMAIWGHPGSLHIDHTTPPRVSAQGIAHLHPDDPQMIDATVYPTDATPTAKTRKALGQAYGPLATYADAPFVVVLGSGEDAAAQADNRALAQAFLDQWAQHAQGQPQVFLDTAFPKQDFPHHHLILIGNSRSNAVLKDLVKDQDDFPLHWNSRELIYANRHFLRSEHRAVALAWPHPARDGRLLVVLDGAPGWPLPGGDSGLPLAGLPDLVISGDGPNATLAVWKIFNNQWR